MQHLQTVQEIFQDKLFKIPDYQRGYAWGKEQWEELIEDIELIEDNQEHYAGTLVIHTDHSNGKLTDDEGSTYGKFNVVDGQQRLTTISIILIVLCDELENLGKEQHRLANGIRQKYLFTKKDDIDLPKLELNNDTKNHYQVNIIGKGSVSGSKIMSEQRLTEAKDYYASYFKAKRKELKKDYLIWIKSTYSKISSCMKLTVYQVPQESEVGVIFEVMNNRGKKLTEMEKVKNYLLYLASKMTCSGGDELAVKINETWTYIFESLMASGASGSEYENQLLRNNWLMFANYNPKKWNGSKSIKEIYNLKDYKGRHDELRNGIRHYNQLLKDSCTAYCDVIAPGRNDAFSKFRNQPEMVKKVRRWTEKFTRIGAVASFMPLLTAVRLKNPDDLELYFQYLLLCEKFAFRVYRLADKRSNTGQTTLFRFANQLFHDQLTNEVCFNSIRSLLLYYAPAKRFEETVNTLGRDWYNWFGLKYMLYEYEHYLAAGEPVEMSWEDLYGKDKKDTIEHILPQTPTKDYWKRRWKKDQVENALNDFGNLVMTFNNSVYSNKGFGQKKGGPGIKKCYANSSLFMERAITQYADWTYREFEQRRKEMAAWIIDRWLVDEAETLFLQIEEDADVEELMIPD